MIWITLFLVLCGFIDKSQGEDIGDVQYLIKYGYLEIPKESVSPVSFSEKDVDSALKTAQKFAGIPMTGKLDNETIMMLTAPRCGLPDTGSRVNRYGTYSKWNKRHLTYRFSNLSPKLGVIAQIDTFRKAFSTWAQPTGLKFSLVNSEGADILIGFYSRHHGDGYPFDGPGNVIGHAFFPPDGKTHFDNDDEWTTAETPKRGKNILLSTATHQLGHALGLEHSYDPFSIMAPIYTPQITLGDDDVKEIQSLYGRA